MTPRPTTALATFLVALSFTPAWSQTASTPATERDVPIRDTVEHVLPAITFDAVGLADVVDYLRDISGANIFVNWKSLEAAGIERNTPVSASVRNVKFAKAITLVLESVPGKARLGYTFADGVITISTSDDLARDVVVRVYDIRDLLVTIPDFTSTPEDAGPAPTTRPATPQDKVDALIRVILDTLDPSSWKDRGGSVGAMRELEGQLIVTQTPDNHRKLVELLTGIRRSRSLQVTVEARYINCEFQTIETLVAAWNRSSTPLVPAGGESNREPVQNRFPAVFLNQDQVQQLLKLWQAAPQSMMITAPRITLFNGQRAFVKVATSTSYLAGYTPTTSGDREVRYEPLNKSVEAGITTDLSATVTDDHQSVTLTIFPRISTFLGFTRAPWPGSPRNVDLMIQEPHLKISQLQSTLTIPSGATALLGGLEDPSTSFPDNPTSRPTRGLYLLVTPTVIAPPPDEGARFPLFSPKGEAK